LVIHLIWPFLGVLSYTDFGVYRLPLANREYIKTAGLRSTVAWAMASLAEISVSERRWQRCRALHKGGLLLGRAEAGVLEQRVNPYG